MNTDPIHASPALPPALAFERRMRASMCRRGC